MKLSKNENVSDRLTRIIFAEVFFLLAFFWVGGLWQVVFYVLSGVMLFTAITGFCALYRFFGIDTARTSKLSSKIVAGASIFLFMIIAIAGSYYSNFFTKKFFLEDYNKMNQYYKQTLFYTGQEKRTEAVDNYGRLVAEYALFDAKYLAYHPYVISGDAQFNADIAHVSDIVSGLREKVDTGNLKLAHVEFEQVRPIFQDILKRNGFSMLAVSLVDFHDAMEKVIAAADAKDSAWVIGAYAEADTKLKAVEEAANDSEIQAIRAKLNEVLSLAMAGKVDILSAKAAELKSAFVKVYLKRG